MDAPTGADIRSWSPPDFDWTSLGYPPPAGSDPDPLDKRVEWAAAYVEGATWRPISSIVAPGTDPNTNLPQVEDTPVNLVSIAEQTIMLATLQLVANQSAGVISAELLQGYIVSFTAGSYSETRSGAARGPTKLTPGLGLVNAWEPLSDLLYMLMTPDAYDYWRYRLTGQAVPAAGYVETDFGHDGMREARPMVWGPGVESWPVGG